MRRMRTLVAAVMAIVALTAAPGSAAPTTRHTPTPWTLVRDADFGYEAGQVCDFEVRATLLRDGDWVSTFAENPRRQIIVGPLVYRVTNTETGRSVVRDFGGTTEATLR